MVRVAPHVANHAVGGARANGLLTQVRRASLVATDVAVLSIGTNDARAGVTADMCAAAVADAVGSTACKWIYVDPPLLEHSTWGDAVAAGIDAKVIGTRDLLRPLGARAFAHDGLHLSGPGYAVLVPAIAGVISSC